MMAIYGYPEPCTRPFRQAVVDEFHFVARPDAQAFRDGTVFDLGGGVRIRVLHAPGHTRGHSFFWIEPEDVLYLATSISQLRAVLRRRLVEPRRLRAHARRIASARTRHWATFHHIGVLDDRAAFWPASTASRR